MNAQSLRLRVRGMTAVVTAGSTIGQIDAVRYVEAVVLSLGGSPDAFKLERFEMQNPFTGLLGLRMAESLNRLGVRVRLLTRTELLSGVVHQLPKECILDFRTFEELEQRLPVLLEDEKPGMVFQAAAVSDWVPKSVEGVDAEAREGKIESAAEELRIIFRRTPKLIDQIRPLVGPAALIVGFKLAVRVSDEQLLELARKQMLRARSDYCVGNDYAQITKTLHPVQIFGANGSRTKFSGSKKQTAECIVETILAQHFQ